MLNRTHLKYLLPRKVREAMSFVWQFLLRLRNDDESKIKYYKSYFDSTRSIFIHIPKCAGTSVAKVLYGEDPWHHSIKAYESDERFERYVKFAVIRDPVGRFISIYQYLVRNAEKYPDSIYTDAKEAGSLERFFSEYVEGLADNERNYFLRSQSYYVCNSVGRIAVDYLLRMDHLDDDFEPLREYFSFYEKFPRENAKKDGDRLVLSDSLKERIATAYSRDFELMNNGKS